MNTENFRNSQFNFQFLFVGRTVRIKRVDYTCFVMNIKKTF